MENFKMIPGGICAPAGFSAAGVHCGIRHNHSKLDLALIKADVRCAGAGCYTTNKVYGAPITVDREHLKDGYAQAIVVNSGNANTCAPNGIELAKETCEIVAKELGISADDVLPSSTGVIGQAMSIEPFAKGIPEAAAKLAAAMVMPGLRAFKAQLDPNKVGGTAFIGISRPVIKAHGSSNAEAIDNAIGQARQVAESGIIGQIQENVHLMQVQPE